MPRLARLDSPGVLHHIMDHSGVLELVLPVDGVRLK